MPLPAVVPKTLGILTFTATSGLVVANTRKAWRQKSEKKDVEASYNAGIEALEQQREETNHNLADYGMLKAQTITETSERLVDWIDRNGIALGEIDSHLLGGLTANAAVLPDMKQDIINAQNTLKMAGAAALGTASLAASQFLVTAGVSSLAHAGTGTAISSLSGAAANSAVLAWLGGGSLASGGGGVAAGATILAGAATIPVLLISGVALRVIVNQRQKSTDDYIKAVREAIKVNEQLYIGLQEISDQVADLTNVLYKLRARALDELQTLESTDFEPEKHADQFVEALALCKSISSIADTPLTHPQTGQITQESLQITQKNANVDRP